MLVVSAAMLASAHAQSTTVSPDQARERLASISGSQTAEFADGCVAIAEAGLRNHDGHDNVFIASQQLWVPRAMELHGYGAGETPAVHMRSIETAVQRAQTLTAQQRMQAFGVCSAVLFFEHCIDTNQCTFPPPPN